MTETTSDSIPSEEKVEVKTNSKAEEMQTYVQQNYSTLVNSKDAAVGQFKAAIPLPDDGKVGVVVMSRSSSAYDAAKSMMDDEMAYLKFLESSNFTGVEPLRTYGEIFKVSDAGKDYPAMLVDWIPNATLIDSKDPEAFTILLSGLVTNMKIPTQKEAWPMRMPEIMSKLSSLEQTDLQRAENISRQLLEKLSAFQSEMKEKQIKIADLQLMISVDENDNVKLTIIDPVAVLEKSENGEFYEDVRKRGVKADDNPDFKRFLSNTDTMLANMTAWCSKFNAADDKQKFLQSSFERPTQPVPVKPDVRSGPISQANVAQMLLGRPRTGAPGRTQARPSYLPGAQQLHTEPSPFKKISTKSIEPVEKDVEETSKKGRNPGRSDL